MDAGDADVELVADALDDAERVVALVSLRAREASTRASGRARADEATKDGVPGLTREMLTSRRLSMPYSTTLSVSSPSPPYACAKRRRERRAACARTRRRRVGNTDGRGRR